ncbi:MAG: hypothetical protein U0Y82_08540 [Thermoleophilia bacterium]
MIPLLLLLIAAILPWIIHLAPPAQRPLALVGSLAVLMLFGIFVRNPLPQWEFWAGLAAGVVSVVALSAASGGGARRVREPRRRVADDG